MDTATVISIIALAFVVLSHLCATVWWMSKMTTTLTLLQKSVDTIGGAITRHEATYYSKEDAAKDFANRDRDIAATWKKIDKLEDSVNGKLMGGQHG